MYSFGFFINSKFAIAIFHFLEVRNYKLQFILFLKSCFILNTLYCSLLEFYSYFLKLL